MLSGRARESHRMLCGCCASSRNLQNEEAMTRVRPQSYTKKKIYIYFHRYGNKKKISYDFFYERNVVKH